MKSPTMLYRLWSKNGDLLYIGLTANLERRITHHRRQQPWRAEIAGFTCEWVGWAWRPWRIEQAAIRRERPRYNSPLSEAQKASWERQRLAMADAHNRGVPCHRFVSCLVCRSRRAVA